MRKMQWLRTYDASYASESNDEAITLNFNIYMIVSLSETPGNSFKIFFSRTTGQILTRLGTGHP
jgi:hypothetical protein